MLFEWQRDLREGLFSASGSQATHLLPIELYLIQAEIRGKPPDERRSVRQARARCPTTLGQWLRASLEKLVQIRHVGRGSCADTP